MIHSLKILILKSFGFLVAVLGRFCLAGAMMVIGAQGLAFMDHADHYVFLKYFLAFEHRLEAPVVSFLHACVPCVYGGFDFAPVAIASVLIVLWVMCEFELHRLRVSTWTVAQDKKASTLKRDAARAQKKAEKERVERNRLREKETALAEKQLAASEKEAAKQAALDEKIAALARKQVEAAEKQAAAAAAKQAAIKPAPAPAAAAPAPAPVRAPAPAPAHAAHSAPPAVESEREKLLELYAQTKKTLEESKKNLSFLAIDVVNSTGMKLGEDPALAERDFRQYKKLVDRIITAHKGLKAAWTPDGVMICFASVQNAVQAAQLIRGLDHFNRVVKTIKADFKVRCGINAGSVMFDDTVRMEEMTDRNIDIAGHMQKYADPNTIYVGAHAIESIRAQFDFHNAEKQVDGHDVYAWRDDTAGAA